MQIPQVFRTSRPSIERRSVNRVRDVPPFVNYDDPDTRRALEWFLGFLEPQEWRARVSLIDQQLDASLDTRMKVGEAQPHSYMSITDDQIGWYLYLVEAVLNDVRAYEPTQGARVVPLFKTIGTNLDLAKKIEGVDDRIHRLLTTARNQPDGPLFELLVALVWRRNGFDVEFLPETPPERSADIRASKSGEHWFIECKRLQKDSDYSRAEEAKWSAMWAPFQTFLIQHGFFGVFDIEFHVELSTLPDSHLVDQLSGKVRLIEPPCTIVDNEVWRVGVSLVNYQAALDHLERYRVKYPGEQFNELIGGRRDTNRRFSGVVVGRYERFGPRGSNLFLEGMDFAAGAFWSCDSPIAIGRKARDIRRHLSEAVHQLPEDEKGVVHVGLETLDGPDVEVKRLDRIMGSVLRFNPHGKDLQWIFCHTMQSYAPPDQGWVIDETVHKFGREGARQPLAEDREFAIPREEIVIEDGVHWLRERP